MLLPVEEEGGVAAPAASPSPSSPNTASNATSATATATPTTTTSNASTPCDDEPTQQQQQQNRLLSAPNREESEEEGRRTTEGDGEIGSSPVGRNKVRDDGDNDPFPPSKYEKRQTVFAQDSDGVVYEAVIRQMLYGPNLRKRVQMATVSSRQEADELLARQDEEDPVQKWHYFVHYKKWNANWDAWVPEENVYELTDESRAYATRLIQEHKALKVEMAKKSKGKKPIDGCAFLREWQKRKAQVDEETQMFKPCSNGDGADNGNSGNSNGEGGGVQSTGKEANKKKPKADAWTKSTALMEKKLREKNLTRKLKNAKHDVAMPFALKKNLVEQWEIITQCNMVLALPATVTVRQALDLYLESKGVAVANEISSQSSSDNCKDGSVEMVTDENSNKVVPEEASGAQQPKSETDSPKDASDDFDSRKQEWIEMAHGIALFFDEALPYRLLFDAEQPQLLVKEAHPEHGPLRYSEYYGCEHLLRLFTRLPLLVADSLKQASGGDDDDDHKSKADWARTIYAKVNHFIRFLHKNQDSVLVQSYRALNADEAKEKTKILRRKERKRIRAAQEAAAAAAGAAVTAATAEGEAVMTSAVVVIPDEDGPNKKPRADE